MTDAAQNRTQARHSTAESLIFTARAGEATIEARSENGSTSVVRKIRTTDVDGNSYLHHKPPA